MHPNVHYSTVYKGHGSRLNVHRRTNDKRDVVLIYNEILLSHEREQIMPSADTQMETETVIQSEVSQKQKTNTI